MCLDYEQSNEIGFKSGKLLGSGWCLVRVGTANLVDKHRGRYSLAPQHLTTERSIWTSDSVMSHNLWQNNFFCWKNDKLKIKGLELKPKSGQWTVALRTDCSHLLLFPCFSSSIVETPQCGVSSGLSPHTSEILIRFRCEFSVRQVSSCYTAFPERRPGDSPSKLPLKTICTANALMIVRFRRKLSATFSLGELRRFLHPTWVTQAFGPNGLGAKQKALS